MLIGNIVNIVQHSHLYNSFILIIVACIVILLVVILYWDHVGFCVIVTFSSIHKLKRNETKLGQNWRTSGTPNFFLELWCNFVSLYWVVYVCWIHVYRFNIILKSFFVIQLHIRTITKFVLILYTYTVINNYF